VLPALDSKDKRKKRGVVRAVDKKGGSVLPVLNSRDKRRGSVLSKSASR